MAEDETDQEKDGEHVLANDYQGRWLCLVNDSESIDFVCLALNIFYDRSLLVTPLLPFFHSLVTLLIVTFSSCLLFFYPLKMGDTL